MNGIDTFSAYFMSIFSALEEAPKFFWDTGIDFYNGCVKVLLSVLTVKVANAGGQSDSVQGVVSEAYRTVMQGGAYENFLLLGGSLTICFFLIGYCRDSIDIRKISNLEENLFLFIKLFLGVGCVTQIGVWMPRLVSWSTLIIQEFFHVTTVGITKTGADFYESIDNPIASVIFGIIFAIVMAVCGSGILMIGLSRVFKLLIYMALAPAMLSTIAGGSGMNRAAVNWIKEFIATCFSNVVIVLAVMVSTKLVGINLKPGWDGILAAMLLIVESVCVLGLIKTSDGILSRMLGTSG